MRVRCDLLGQRGYGVLERGRLLSQLPHVHQSLVLDCADNSNIKKPKIKRQKPKSNCTNPTQNNKRTNTKAITTHLGKMTNCSQAGGHSCSLQIGRADSHWPLLEHSARMSASETKPERNKARIASPLVQFSTALSGWAIGSHCTGTHWGTGGCHSPPALHTEGSITGKWSKGSDAGPVEL